MKNGPPEGNSEKAIPVKKTLSIVLDQGELVELERILIDEDEAEALAFLKKHVKGKVRELLEGG